MTPKEKAEELIGKFPINGFYLKYGDYKEHLKLCALVAVDEILKSNPTTIDCDNIEFNYKFWTEVKKEIEKL